MQITKVIRSKGLTLACVAERMGISKGSLSNSISKGNLTVDTLRRIAKAAECDVSDFFEDERINRQETVYIPLTAMIDCNGELFKATDTESLQQLINSLKEKSKNK